MNGQKISETEALDIIARVFDRNMRRMNYVRGELFIFWGALLSLTALAEYGLYHWTGDVRVLWSWLAPLVCGYIWTVRNSRRKALVRTGFDDLLILIWGMPAMISAAAEQGDPIALEAFRYTGEMLGRALADVVTVTSPQAIFLFGGLSKAGKLIFEPTQWYMEENMLFVFKNKVKLLPSGIQGKNAAILGASALIWQEAAK